MMLNMPGQPYTSGAIALLCSVAAILAGSDGHDFASQWNGVFALANAMVCVAEIAWLSDAQF